MFNRDCDMTDAELDKLYDAAFAHFGVCPPWERRERECQIRQGKLRYLRGAEMEIHRSSGLAIHNGAEFMMFIGCLAPEKSE